MSIFRTESLFYGIAVLYQIGVIVSEGNEYRLFINGFGLESERHVISSMQDILIEHTQIRIIFYGCIDKTATIYIESYKLHLTQNFLKLYRIYCILWTDSSLSTEVCKSHLLTQTIKGIRILLTRTPSGRGISSSGYSISLTLKFFLV